MHSDGYVRIPKEEMMTAKYPQVVQLETEDGMSEATKPAQDEAWEISYPWGGDRFFGSKSQVEARMKKRIAQEQE